MFLCEGRFSPLSFISAASPSSSASTSARYAAFEASIRRRLHSLLPSPTDANTTPAVPLDYLSRAVGVLASAHADASRLIRDLCVASDTAALYAYLDTSLGILDLCNFASAGIDRFLRGRLLLAYAVRLLADGVRGKILEARRIEKAKQAIAEWDNGEEEKGHISAKNVNRKAAILAPGKGGKGSRRLSVLGKVVFAVEAVFALVRDILVRLLSPDDASPAVALGVSDVPDELLWAGVYRDLQTACFNRRSPPLRVLEMEAVRSRTKEVTDAMDCGRCPDHSAASVKELEDAVEDLNGGLGSLAEVVTGLFRSALRAKDATVENLHGRHCKSGTAKLKGKTI